MQSELINIYDVGYTCEKHNKKYIDSCDLCSKNLCEKCKLYHFHIIKKENHVNLDENELLNSVNLTKLEKTKDYIKYYLIERFLYMKNFNLINVKIMKSLHFIIKKQEITFFIKDFFCQQFYDEEFRKYYKKLLDDAEKDKQEEYKALTIIKNNYKKINLYVECDYNDFKNKCKENQKQRNDDLNNIYFRISNTLLYIQQLFEKDDIFDLQTQINENKMDIILLNSKILGLSKSSQSKQLFIKKLLTRYFADYIIRVLIKKYPHKFCPIKLSLSNIYEIITNYGVEFLKENKMQLINTFIGKLIFNKDNFNINQYKSELINYINNINDENKILFKESITIQSEVFEKDELNFALSSLFYLKQIDNYVTHPNITKEISSKINEISSKVIEIKKIIEPGLLLSNNLNEETSLIDIALKEEIKKFLNGIKAQILYDVQDFQFEKDADVQCVLDYMLKNNNEQIFKGDTTFLRTINSQIDKIIDNDNDFDNLNDNIQKALEILKKIDKKTEVLKNTINNFESFNIEQNKRFESTIKNEFKELQDIDLIAFEELIDKYKKMVNKNLTTEEIRAYIISIFAQKYLESSIFIEKQKNIKKK